MKTFRLFSMAAVALLMAACSNSDDFDVQKPAETAGVFHFEATIAAPNADASTRTVYTEDGTTINVKWKVGDQIALVHNGVVNVAEVKTVDDVTGKATIEADITGSPSNNDDVYLAYPADAVYSATPYDPFPFTPNSTIFDKVQYGQDGTLEFIQNNLDLRMGSGKLAVSGGKATLKGSVSIPSLICIWKLTLQDESSNALNATKLTFKNNTDTQAKATMSTGKSEYYLCVVPSFIPDPSGTFSFEATVGSDTYTYSKSGVSLAAGKYYQSTLKMTEVVPEAVDLGLPSGTLWANMNVGAASEGDYGQFFAWGETTGYDSSDGHNFGWASYSLCGGSNTTLTKYNNNASYGTVDNKTTLEAADDAATANWGGDWRMPTKAELEELFATKSDPSYTWTWTTVDGHNGYKITNNTTGANIFLPAAGYREGTSLYYQGTYGFYCSSSLFESEAPYGCDLSFDSGEAIMGSYYRFGGQSVRAVQGAPAPVVPTGALSGKFSVSDTKKVYFSKGNLQYQASTSTWRFAEHQYDYVGDGTNGTVSGSNNALISSSYTGWIDLFGWGTSGKTISNYGTANQPYATSYTDTAYGPSGNYNLTGTYADGDWGVNMGSGWRTLTKDEWVYLFDTRTVNNGTGSGKSYTLGSVNGVSGLVLYPDDYTGSTYSGSNWADFENAGCVFLPAAGYRDGTFMDFVGSYGYYWSSTAGGTGYACGVYFYSGYVGPAGNNNRYLGFSVRLVREVPAGSQGTGANDRSYGNQSDLGTW